MLKRSTIAAIAAAAVAVCSFSENARATVSTTATSITYSASGSTGTFTVPFPFQRTSDLVVTDNGTTKTLGSDYTVACAGCSSGGTVRFTVNPGAGHLIVIQRSVPLTQLFNPPAQGRFYPPDYASAFDNLEMQIQQVDAKVPGGTTATTAYVDAAINATLTGGTVVAPITWGLTGDGSTASFSIPNAPLSNADLYEVTIDGLVQRPNTDYTVSAGTAQVTFTTAPAYGAAIVVRSVGYAKATSVGDNTSVLATGTTVPRPLKDWFGDIINVKGDGADSTGGVDAGAAIQAAINAVASAGGGVVYLPRGTYKVATTLAHGAKVRLVGDGKEATIINYTGASWAIDIADVAQAKVEHLSISIGASAAGGVRLHAGAVLTAETRDALRYVMVKASVRTAGQIGFLLQADAAAAGVYHNDFAQVATDSIDIGVKFTSLVNNQGANGNTVHGLNCNGQSVCVLMQDGTDNVVLGLQCLGGVSSPICISMPGHANGYGADHNVFSGFNSEQGAGSTTVSIAAVQAGQRTPSQGNNLFVGSSNDVTQITDNSAATASTANVWTLTTQQQVNKITVQQGVGNNGGGIKHIRGTGICNTAAAIGATCTSGTIPWSTAFPDLNYTLACSLEAPAGQPHLVAVGRLLGGFTLQIAADTAVAANANYDCIATHD
jgi:hypothetical protein